ncbi:tetratricopeptide repeat protein [Streptomyces sp. SID8382]|nr:tetratricopeptide repeat protein [Streptomyces sp. SID8382]
MQAILRPRVHVSTDGSGVVGHAAARLLADLGDATGLTAAYEVLLAEQVRPLGRDHPDTFIARGNLARLRGEMGDAAGAAAVYEELVDDHVRVLGRDHPDTFIARRNLVSWRGRPGIPLGSVRRIM